MATGVEFHDVKYDGDLVSFYDRDRKIISSFEASLFKGTKKNTENNGELQKQIDESTYLVVNPYNTSALGSAFEHGWYAISKISEKHGYIPYLGFDPKFITNSNQLLNPSKTYIVKSTKVPFFNQKKNSYFIIPLLETVIRINQEFYGMTLRQIAIVLNGCQNPDFIDDTILMSFVYGKFMDRIKKLCMIESCPVIKLYLSNFNNYFDHLIVPQGSPSGISSTVRMQNVTMIVLANLVDKENCANIAWFKETEEKRRELIGDAKCLNYPFVFLETAKTSEHLKNVTRFIDVSIFPRIQIGESFYPEGSMIGITDTGEVIVRGEIFENITLREHMILLVMYDAYVNGSLTAGRDCTGLFKYLEFENHQFSVNAELIKKIQKMLFIS